MGAAIPCSKTILREITSKKRVNEGEFQFDAVKKHIEEWNSPPYVHIQLDDTRVIPKIEYDPQTNRFIGFCLPIHDGIPFCDTFVLNTFEEIKSMRIVSLSNQLMACLHQHYSSYSEQIRNTIMRLSVRDGIISKLSC